MARIGAHPAARLADAAAPWVRLVETRRPMRLPTLLRQLHRTTLALYVAAVELPRPDADAPHRPEAFRVKFWRVLEAQQRRLGQHSSYRAAYDALNPAEPAGGYSLPVDLADTWEDVAFGLSCWRGGRRDDAHAVWWESYRYHWHKHVSDALHVLHQHVEVVFPTGS
jgi:hypothetical protein